MKRLSSIILILSAVLVFYVFTKFIPNIYFNIGKNAYEAKDYVKAYKTLKIAVRLSHNNRDYRYYYVLTMLNLRPTLEIQKELFAVAQENLADTADLIADNQVEKWRQQIFFNVGENYIEQVPFNDKILRWDVKKFPLKVKIENASSTSVPGYYKSEIQKSFIQWQNSTNNLMQFKFVEGDDAEIIVKIIPSSEMNNCKEEICKYVVAYTVPAVNGDLLKNMTINFYDKNSSGQPFSEKEIFNTALHEIGHALGIMGHSYNKNDLMYMEDTPDEHYDVVRSDFLSISQVDLNTLDLLYKLIPDISNTYLHQFDTSQQFFAPIVLGSEEKINSRKLLEAENYIKSAPNLPNGYVDLANAYAEQKEYGKAIKSLETALSLSSLPSEQYMAYYNMAVIYLNIKDWDNALKYAQMAKDSNPQANLDGSIDGMIAFIEFQKGNIQSAKQAYKQILQNNPGSTIDAVNLARIYIQEYNLPQAGKVLNRLVQANPSAKDDPKVKVFGLLMFLFK